MMALSIVVVVVVLDLAVVQTCSSVVRVVLLSTLVVIHVVRVSFLVVLDSTVVLQTLLSTVVVIHVVIHVIPDSITVLEVVVVPDSSSSVVLNLTAVVRIYSLAL